ncbi:ParB N-terminal domain-containing protein [Spirillospora sp. NPDC048819]|uniref:ParB/RepB/Spo0J family partition protein n=1 Tax=Spirillospora sp. NPDC048819 TaxID=3155268 RepID=UPI0033ED75FA
MAIELLRPADTPRLTGEDEDHIRKLAEAETDLPPILVHRRTMRVIDGTHRLGAAMLRNQTEIKVIFFDGSEDEAFVRAVKENVSHGLPLSLAERRSAAARIIRSRPESSDRAIGRWTGLSPKTVRTLRRRSNGEQPQSNVRIGADNRVRPLNGTDGRRRAADVIMAQPDASLREIARTAAISVGTAHDVRKRMHRGEDPVLTGGRAAKSKPRVASPSGRARESRGETARRPGGAFGAGEPQHAVLLRKLKKDPSLRHSDVGRELLRWLHGRAVFTGDWSGLVSAIPSHCAGMVAELARACATTWNELALELENRAGGVYPADEVIARPAGTADGL